MKKKLSLDETWRLCLSMWRWIAKQRRKNPKLDVWKLKFQWLEEHGFPEGTVDCACFFCEYREMRSGDCSKHCPGVKVDREFMCDDPQYDYEKKPIAFYNKLRSLNRRRLAKK